MGGIKIVENEKETVKALNRLAREELKYRMLTDIRADIEVCKIEGWDYMEYLQELQELLNSLKK